MRLEKQAIVNELRAALADAAFLILTDFRGLKARQAEDLRRRLLKTGAHYHVVKNTFLRRALEAHRWIRLPAAPLTGPTGLVYGPGDVVEAARAIDALRQDLKVLTVKQGLVPGAVLGPEEMNALVALPPRPVLLAMMVGTVAAPMRQLAGVLSQKLASLVYVLRAAQDAKRPSQG